MLELEGNVLRSVPDGIGDLIRLERLDLDNNELTELPERISWLPCLEQLEVEKSVCVCLRAVKRTKEINV